jgi:hypothetical protein
VKYRTLKAEQFIAAMRRRGRLSFIVKDEAQRLEHSIRGGNRNKGLPSPNRGKVYGPKQWAPSKLRLLPEE